MPPYVRPALLCLSAAALCNGQSSSTISLSNGVQLQVTANLGQPTGQEMVTVQMVRASGNSFYRIFRDQNQVAIFAYELAVELTSNGAELHATAKPATGEFARQFPNADGGKPTPTLSSVQALDPLASGRDGEIGLFAIPGMGLQVRYIVHVLTAQAGGSTGPLRFSRLRVSINGKVVAGPSAGSVSNRFVMFYIPGQGGYFFATESAGSGFIKAGTIDRNRVQFVVDNEVYECVASEPIFVPANGADLWVYHDRSYKPAGNWTHDSARPDMDAFYTAAADSLGWWLPQ